MFETALTRTPKSTVFGPRDPFHGLFDRMFDNFWNDSDFVPAEAGRRTWLPAVDIYESDRKLNSFERDVRRKVMTHLSLGRTADIGSEITAMLQSMKHRGPDSTGYALYGPADDMVVVRFVLAEPNETGGFGMEERLERTVAWYRALLEGAGAATELVSAV